MKNFQKQLQKIIDHISDFPEDCECEICYKQENGTYLDGLEKALELTKN